MAHREIGARNWCKVQGIGARNWCNLTLGGQGPPELNYGPGGPGPPRADQNLNKYITLKAVELRQLRIYDDNLVLFQDFKYAGPN